MDPFSDPCNVVTFTSWLLALILDTNEAMLQSAEEANPESDFLSAITQECMQAPLLDTVSFLSSSLHNYRLLLPPIAFGDDVTYWVKPRSTTWFSRFLLEQYDNTRWLSMFRMTKASVFALADLLKPHVEKKNTRYRLSIPVLIRVACTLFKLTHGANLTICSEMFAIGRSTVCKVLREVVHAINDTLKQEISWPHGDRLRETQAKFCSLCSLPAVVGAIDGMQVSISKPVVDAADYFYFKTGGYSVNCQAVVDSDKRFLDLYVGMPGSTNDSRMLRRSSLHYLASHGNLFDTADSVDGHAPFLIGDSGYPLLPWLMVPHRGGRQHSVAELLFNRKLRRGRCVVENAFGILKQTFRELLDKSDLKLTFLPDVIVCCAILHNLLLRQSHTEVEDLLSLLRSEGRDRPQSMTESLPNENNEHPADTVFSEDDVTFEDWEASDDGNSDEVDSGPQEDLSTTLAIRKRLELGIFLTTRRN